MIPARRAKLAESHPLDFTLQYPPRREYFQESFRAPLAPDTMASLKQTLLYVHIPFCAAKCYFCNFAVDVRRDPVLHQRYTDLLCDQLAMLDDLLPEHTTVPGIDIGGGTPTLLEAAHLTKILKALKPWQRRVTVGHPLSIETTPRIAAEHPERLEALVSGGVSRISMGVQSANAATLAAVNRSEQENMTAKAVANLRAAGFRRINIDVIFALAGQTTSDWNATLDAVLDMGVDSITTYDCLYRGKGRALTKRTADKPSPGMYGALYDHGFNRLAAAGYHAQYGSVNFSRHAGETGTSPYFEGRLFDHVPYLGAGNYASSMTDDFWWFAPYGVNAWMDRVAAGEALPQGDCYRLPASEMMAKQTLLSLNFGVIDSARFEKRFGIALDDIYGDALDYGVAQGWLVRLPQGYGVAPGFFSHMPQIRALFYTGRAANWLAQAGETPVAKKEKVFA